MSCPLFLPPHPPRRDCVRVGRAYADRRRLVHDLGDGPAPPVQGGLQPHAALEKAHRWEERLRWASLRGGRRETTPARLPSLQAGLPPAADPARKTNARRARGRLPSPTSSTPVGQD